MSFWRISVTQLSFAIGLDTSQVPAEAAKAGAEAGKQLKSSFEQNVAKLKMPQLRFEVDQKGNGLKVVGEALKATEEQAKKTAGTLKGRLGGAVKSVTGFFSKLGEVLKGQVGQFALVQTAANLLTSSLLAIAKGIGAFVQQAAKMEVLVLQLEAFIGSAEGAAAAYDEFRAVAEKTPFNVSEVANAGKIMLGFGVEADRAVESTKQLAIVASAVGGDMNNLARNLGQVSAQQRAYTRDLTQFAIQGIPIWQELSKATGRSVVDLKKMATEGKIGMDEVTVALTNMTEAGSDFANISNEMENTLIGKMQKLASTITDAALNLSALISAVDETTGLVSGLINIFQGGLDLINGGIKFATDNMKLLTSATIFLGTAAGVLFGILNFNAIVIGIGTVIAAMAKWNIVTGIANALNSFLAIVTGNWGAVAAAITVAVGVTIGFNALLDDQLEKQKQLKALKDKETEATKKQQAAEAEKAKTQEGLNSLIEEGNKELAKLRELEKENGGFPLEQQKKDYDDLAAKVRVWTKTYDELYGEVARVNAEIKKAKKLEEDAVKAAAKRKEAVSDEKRAVDRAREDLLEGLSDEKTARDRIREDVKAGMEEEKQAKDRAHEDALTALDDEKRAYEEVQESNLNSIDKTKEAVESNAEAAIEGIEKVHNESMDAIDAEIDGLDAKKDKADSVYDAASANIEKLKDEEESRHEASMSAIDSQLDALENSMDQQKAMVERLKDSEKSRHDRAIDNLDRQKDAAKRNYDAEIAQLDAIKARNLDSLNALSPAEKELRDIRLAGLQATAKDSSKTRLERLEAQATLDEMKRQEAVSKVITADTAERDRLSGNLEATQEAINSKVESEKAAHERNMTSIENQDKARALAFENDKGRLEEMKEAETTAHDAAMTRLEDREGRAGAARDAAIAGIENEERELKSKADEEVKLHDDQLKRVEDEKTAKLTALDDEKTKIEEMKTTYDTDHAEKLARLEKEKTERDRAYEDEKKAFNDKNTAEDRAHEDKLEDISDEKTATDRMYEDIMESISDVRTAEKEAHDAKMIELKAAGDEAIAQNKRVADAAKKQQDKLKVKVTSTPKTKDLDLPGMAAHGFMASGGPVTGGTTYTVNELGQESFLSASGKLSMIKAPSWGDWKAPGKGTVIPAHLTSQMSIPSGGVKVGGGAHSNSMKAAQGGGMNRLVSAIRNSAGGGGNYNNQVTIQSSNPNQTASDMLVSLNRIKRRRYS